jgi:ribosome-associated translation inhibitor RaiA
MNVHISYRLPKTADIENQFNQGIEKLSRRLQVYRPELVHLHGNIEENSAREGVVVSLNLRLPSGQMEAREHAPNAVAAIRSVFDHLIEEVIKHKDHLRSEYKWPRRRRVGRARQEPQVPFEQTFAAVQPLTISNADISEYINANLGRLRRFVERELRFRESSGTLAPDQLSPEEVIDEAVAGALGNGIEKPEKLALEPWLYRLSLRAIHELVNRGRDGVEGVPLDSPALRPHTYGSDENHLQYHQPDESVSNRDLIADTRVATPEASAASDEMITLVESALMGA